MKKGNESKSLIFDIWGKNCFTEEPAQAEVQERRSVPPGAVQVLPTKIEDDRQKNNGPLKYGPLGPGDRRTSKGLKAKTEILSEKSESYDTDNELDTSSEDGSIPRKKSSPKVAYTPLEPDSDQEEVSQIHKIPNPDAPKIKSTPIGAVPKRFPNPDHYEDPRRFRATSPVERPWRKTGDFNEIGIPIVEPSVQETKDLRSSREILEERMLSPQYERKASQDRLDTVRTLFRSMDEARFRSQPDVMEESSLSIRPPSGGQESSGFGSLPDVRDRATPQEQVSNSRDNVSSKKFKSQPFACTDL